MTDRVGDRGIAKLQPECAYNCCMVVALRQAW